MAWPVHSQATPPRVSAEHPGGVGERVGVAPACSRAGTRTSLSAISACHTARLPILPVITVDGSNPGVPFSHQVAADVPVVAARPDDGHVGERRVADPPLGAVEHVLVAVAAGASSPARPSLTRGRARSGRRRRSSPACAIGGSQRALLLLAAEQVDRAHRQPGVHARRTCSRCRRRETARGRSTPAQTGQPRAAVSLDGGAGDPELGELGHQLERELGPLPVLVDDRQHLVIGERRTRSRTASSSSESVSSSR